MRNVLAILLLSSWLPMARAQIPVKLDQLDPSLIPVEERFPGQPKELVAILGSGRGRHWAPLTNLAYSPDGKYLACGTWEGDLCIWDRTNMSLSAMIHGHDGYGCALAFSPNSQVLVSSKYDLIPKEPGGPIKGEMKIWHVPTLKLVGTLPGPTEFLYTIAISPDGKWLALADNFKRLQLWDFTKSPPQLHANLSGHREDVTSVLFSPDGKVMLTGDAAGELHLWEMPSGKHISGRGLTGDTFRGMAFGGDGKSLLAFTDDKLVRIPNWNGNEVLQRPALKHANKVVSMALSRDGKRLATVDDMATVHLWDLARQQPLEVGSLERAGAGPPGPFGLSYLHVTFAPDGKSLSVLSGLSHIIRQWDVSEMVPKERLSTPGPHEAVKFLTWAPDGRQVITADEENRGWVWDWQDNQFRQGIAWSLGSNGNRPCAIAVTKDAHTLAAATDGGIQLWDLSIRPPRPGSKITYDPEVASDWSGLAFARNGKTLAAGHLAGDHYGHPILLIDVASKQPKERQKLENRLGEAMAMAFSPDARTLGVARYYSPARQLFVDGKLFVNGPGQTLRIFEIATGRERWSFTRQKSSVQSLSFAPDGTTLAIGWADGQVTLIETSFGKERAEIQAGKAAVNAIAFSPNSKWLATATQDGQVAVWAGSEKRWSVKLPGPVHAVAWAPDSRHLATGNANGTVYVLRMP